MATFMLKCRVMLEGATMIIEAQSEADAARKAKAEDWDDIEYDSAELVDWEAVGKPKLDE